MTKFEVLNELIDRVQSGELEIGRDKEEAERLLSEIYLNVQVALYDEIVEHITAHTASYYAPEYPSWKEFLSACYEDEDMQQVLQQEFSDEEIEELWQNSHITEELDEQQIKEELVKQIAQLKMTMLVSRTSTTNPEIYRRFYAGRKARIQGLFNILFE